MKNLLLLLFACFTLQAAFAQRIPFDSTNNRGEDLRLEDLVSIARYAPSDPRSKLRTALFLLEQEFLKAQQEGIRPEAFVSSQPIVMVQNGMVRIQAAAEKDVAVLMAGLERLGATQFDYYGRIINAWFPIGKISELPYLNGLQFAKPVYWVKGDIGSVDSEGDLALQAIAARQNYCVNGAGVRVGILSDSYTTAFPGGAAAGVASGDLPGVGNPNGFLTPVTVVADGAANNIDEGRAMAEIVHDLAPGAQLFFNTANGGEASFATAILNLDAVRNCDVIVDDIRYFEEPFYMDGPVALACNTVFNNGVAYFASAGNYGRLSYESAYRSSGGALNAHDFDPGPGIDTLQTITVNAGSTINLTLQWDDPWGSLTPNSAATNLDVFLLNAGGAVVASSTDNNVGNDPTEFFSYVDPNGAGTVTYRILITRPAGPPTSVLKWVIRNSNGLVINEYPPTTVNEMATGYGHSNATGANAVAAAFWANTPAYGVNPPTPEGFTSNGGVQIRYNTAGVPITPVTRNKPNFCAVDGVSNTFFGNGNNFFGTSAAAPHAAAVAALMLEANSSLTPTQVRNLLVTSSIDMLTPGFDFTTGSGLIQADVAVREAIELQCNITNITVQNGPTCIAGQGTYSVTLRISYTNPPACNDSLWVNGQVFGAIGATFQDVTLTGLDPNGLPVSVTAYFKSADGCSRTVNNLFTAPQKPSITCPAAQVLVLDQNCSAVIPNYIPLATVNSPAPGTVVTQAPPAGAVVSDAGVINVTITVTDDCGSTNCTFMVTKVDNTPPTAVCNDYTVTFNGQTIIPLEADSLVTADDNCGVATIELFPTGISCEQLGQIVPVTVTVTDINMNVAACISNITVAGLPCGWSQQPNGVNCPNGNSIAYAPPTGIWTATSTNCFYGPPFSSDATAFAQRTLCGDGSLTAEVTDISGTALGWAGIVMRESNAAGAKKAQLVTNLNNLSRREFRTTTNGAANPQQFPSQNRYWLRLVRVGNQFSMYVSPNGAAWYFVGAQNIPMNVCIQMGLVATNYQQTSTVVATFANVSYTGSNVPPLAGAEGAASIEQPHGFEAYPNPTSGELNVNLAQYLGRAVRVEVYGLTGQLLRFVEIEEVQTTVEQLDMSQLENGMYLVKVKSDGLPDATRRVVLAR
ncbi:MAG: S8 family serine peptidase [Saprospiraceae bacterium]|nr:S8 family serine peptidase [Saprospiraceae bacterium]